MKRWKKGLLFVSIGMVVLGVAYFAFCDSVTLTTQLGAGAGLWTGEDTDDPADGDIDVIHPNEVGWNVGIGTTNPGDDKLSIDYDPSDDSGAAGILVDLDAAATTDGNYDNYGGYFATSTNIDYGVTNVGSLRGVQAQALNQSAGYIDTLIGMMSVAGNWDTAGGTAATVDVLRLTGVYGAGTVGTLKLLHLVYPSNIDQGTLTTGWGIYDSAGLDWALVTDGQKIRFGADTANDYSIEWDGNDAVHTITAGDFVFTGGNVGIGTTLPQRKFHVSGGEILIDNNYAIQSINSTLTGRQNILKLEADDQLRIGGGGAIVGMKFDVVGGDPEIVVNNLGNVGIGTTTPNNPLEMGSGAHVTTGGVWTNASSIEYKTDVAPLMLDKALEALANLKPVTFSFKVARDERHAGFIAEEVPDLVATKDRRGLSPMDIVAVLTKVVQQQQKEIDELKARLDTVQ